ncbi:hypothetical protein PoB_007394100 [Plakobranchus ocellatus]|uniref:Uncharacterized protein n=1 Tax=Plakobranchus ocellatus TaxID=259542 RepID=A0AAV4DTN2_9GAST|nr:hypothetical protein PoB_007394100 [Plakobranchus ocellatus]
MSYDFDDKEIIAHANNLSPMSSKGRLVAAPASPKLRLTSYPKITPLSYHRWYQETVPVVDALAREQWSEFLNRCPERYQIDLPLEGCGESRRVSKRRRILQSGRYYEWFRVAYHGAEWLLYTKYRMKTC